MSLRSEWAWTEAVARLERIRQIVGRSYAGEPERPSYIDCWTMACHAHLVAMGVRR